MTDWICIKKYSFFTFVQLLNLCNSIIIILKNELFKFQVKMEKRKEQEKLYVYQLPYDIKVQLCRLFDINSSWKELAGKMRFAIGDVMELEERAALEKTSPTGKLLARWGNYNHTVSELFLIVYAMKHVPALKCLYPILEEKCQKLCQKKFGEAISSANVGVTGSGGNAHQQSTHRNGFSDQPELPLAVIQIEKGIHVPSSGRDVRSTNNDSSTNNSCSRSGGGNSILRKVPNILDIDYADLKAATNNWDAANLLGKGGFGLVFKGEIKLLPIAVKRLSKCNNSKDLVGEMCLNQYRHDNILPLYGCSLEGPEVCLVYQLMAGGSLEERLKCRTHYPPLSWSQRREIALGVARGLEYLHSIKGDPLIHGDIKPANILLDQCNMPKIGDFGLAKIIPKELLVSRIYGTLPYLPEDYFQTRLLCTAVDVYSYGVVMLEIATALPVQNKQREVQMLPKYIQFLIQKGVDTGLLEDVILKDTEYSNTQLCRQFVSIGLRCTQAKGEHRPSMLQVYREFETMIV